MDLMFMFDSNKSGIILQCTVTCISCPLVSSGNVALHLVYLLPRSGQMMLLTLVLVLLGATLTESCFNFPGPRNWMNGGYGGYGGGGWMSPLASFYSLGPPRTKPGCPPKQPASREEQLRCFTGRTCTERQELNILILDLGFLILTSLHRGKVYMAGEHWHCDCVCCTWAQVRDGQCKMCHCQQDGTLVEPTRLTDTYNHCPGKFQTKIDNEKKCGGGNFFR